MHIDERRVNILLHDRSRVTIARTTAGLYVEVCSPGWLPDGHGWLQQGTALVTEETAQQLRDLLTTNYKEGGEE